jgi:hypothetical protein
MDNDELIRIKAKEARVLSSQANEKFRQGQYREGHTLMILAREAGRTSAALINQKLKLNKALTQFEEMHQVQV